MSVNPAFDYGCPTRCPTRCPTSSSSHCCPSCAQHARWLTQQETAVGEVVWLPGDLTLENLVVGIALAYGVYPYENTQLMRHDPVRCVLRIVSRTCRQMVHQHSQRIYSVLHARDRWAATLPMVVRELPRFFEQRPWVTPEQLARYGLPINQVTRTHKPCMSCVTTSMFGNTRITNTTHRLYLRREHHEWHIPVGVRWVHEHSRRRMCARLRVDYGLTQRAFEDGVRSAVDGWHRQRPHSVTAYIMNRNWPMPHSVTAYILQRKWKRRLRHHIARYRDEWSNIHDALLLSMRQCAFPGCCEWVGVWKGPQTVCMSHLRWKMVLARLVRPSCWALWEEERGVGEEREMGGEERERVGEDDSPIPTPLSP